MQSPDVIKQAYERINPYIHRTPLMQSFHLNDMFGHEIIFKVEAFQKTGAFKIRGALNALLKMNEQGNLPNHVVTFSSGNHAQAVALACQLLGIKATVFMTKDSSKIKQQATRGYGAEVVLTDTRMEAEAHTAKMAENGAYFLHPFDHDDIIAGQGTSCYEALSDMEKPDAIFATCGGGGWLSGTYLAGQLLAPDIPVYAGEPKNGNDASQSYNSGNIVKLPNPPSTIADGARTMAVSLRTFEYLQKLAGFYEVTEEDIIYHTQLLMNYLKVTVEPTSAVAFAAATAWLKSKTQKKRVLVLLSGGNIDPETYKKIWGVNYL